MRAKPFLKLFFVILFVLSLLVGTTLFSIRPTLTIEDIVGASNFRVPVFLFMGTVLFFVSLVSTWVIQYNVFKREKRIAEKIHDLRIGNYQIPISALEESEEFHFIGEYASMYGEMEQLRRRLIELAREAQTVNSGPVRIGTETKEEILEEERHRLARELHDSVSQQLFAAMMMLSAVNEQKDQIPSSLEKSLQMVEDIVNESQSEMRALLLHLRPVKLEGKTLKKGVEQLLVELKSKVQISMKWEIDSVETVSGIEDHLFRIVQELLSNTLRHAKAKNLEVYLQQNENDIHLRVFDDGVGFDTSIDKTGSYGLVNIRERVSGLGGICKIISFPKQGTIVDIRIPNTMHQEEETNDTSTHRG